MEEWKTIDNYEDLYMVSTLGKVKSLKHNRVLRPNIKHDGYMFVILCKNGKVKPFRVHRLVAQAFIPNPDNLPEVNHKDENKVNNTVENLEWCTSSYNINYGTRNHKCMITRGTPVKCVETRYNISFSERSRKTTRFSTCGYY